MKTDYVDFYLRKDIHFHNETVLTSKDVQFSFERLKEVHSPFEWLTEEIVQIETPSPLQIRFHLAKPNLFLTLCKFHTTSNFTA